MFQVIHERLALELHMIFGFFSLDICEMVIVSRRSLVLKRLLLRRGIATQLVIGAKRGSTAFEAHAWLRLGDEILLGGEGHTEFAPLWSRATREASP